MDAKRLEKELAPFQFETDARPMNREELVKDYEKKYKAELQFDNAYYKPVPGFVHEDVQVKMTEAAMKREIDYINR